MKSFAMKRTALIVVLALCAMAAAAQRLGGVAGYQLSWGFNSTTSDVVNFGATPGSGFLVGVLFDWDITNRWGIEAAATYNLRTTKYRLQLAEKQRLDTANIFKRQLYFLNIPVHAYVNFPFKKWTLALYFGPSFNVGLHGKDIAWQDTEWQKPVMLEDDKIFGSKNEGRLYRFEIGAEIGLRFKYRNYSWSMGYHHGFNNLAKDDDFDWTLTLPANTKKRVTMGEFNVSFAYLFDLKR